MAFALNLDTSQLNHAVKTIKGCYRALRDLDANVLEINPLVLTTNNEIVALDAKMALMRMHCSVAIRSQNCVTILRWIAVKLLQPRRV